MLRKHLINQSFLKRGESSLDRQQHNHQALDAFLATVERRAFRLAEIATGNADDALDLVQEAMMTLVKSYRHKTAQEWGPLFQRILQNRIRDWYRRTRVRNKILDWLGLADHRQDGSQDFIETAVDTNGQSPEQMAENDEVAKVLDKALGLLPLRQQQAFLLRNWEGLSVQQTAAAMSCSQGSVKTHYSRAVHRLRELLEEHDET